jgi:hypothetical protein
MGFGKQIFDQFVAVVAVVAFITAISHHPHHTFRSSVARGLV